MHRPCRGFRRGIDGGGGGGGGGCCPCGGGGSGVAAGKCRELAPPLRVSGRYTGTYARMSKNFCG